MALRSSCRDMQPESETLNSWEYYYCTKTSALSEDSEVRSPHSPCSFYTRAGGQACFSFDFCWFHRCGRLRKALCKLVCRLRERQAWKKRVLAGSGRIVRFSNETFLLVGEENLGLNPHTLYLYMHIYILRCPCIIPQSR